MNNQRRKRLRQIAVDIENEFQALAQKFAEQIEEIRDEEEEAFENLPESLQMGERGDAMQQAIDFLGDAESELESFDPVDVLDAINSAIE